MASPQHQAPSEKPYRHGIVAVIIDRETQKVLVGKIHPGRKKNVRHVWSTVEGGINKGETPEAAAQREVNEEVGLTAPVHRFESAGEIHYLFNDEHPAYKGKSLTVFLCVVDSETFIPNLNSGSDPEGPSFQEVRWIKAEDVESLLKEDASEARAAFCEQLAAQILAMTTAIQAHGVENLLQNRADSGCYAAVATMSPHRSMVRLNQDVLPEATP